jgi:hypothetical protein
MKRTAVIASPAVTEPGFFSKLVMVSPSLTDTASSKASIRKL